MRRFSWDLLRRLSNDLEMVGLPWLVGGDFNEICHESDKEGGNNRPQANMQAFREVLADCRLKDVIARGLMTWYNKRHGNEAVKEWLDIMLINSVWQNTFQTNKVEVLDFYGSDHRPMMLRGVINSTDTWGKRRKRFYFEEKWLHNADFVPDFLNKWEQLKLCSTLPDCLKECQTFLTSLAGNRFDNLGKRIKDLRK